ncbi:MAG: DUF3553 domain-containing protein [Pseudomonadota bacterium]
MEHLEVGALVRLPERPDWGVGQIQSLVADKLGDRITVNFENAGKQVLNGARVDLEVVSPEWR